MTDLNTPLSRGRKTGGAKPGKDPAEAEGLSLPDAKLQEFAELLFFAYRDFTGDPDAILRDFGAQAPLIAGNACYSPPSAAAPLQNGSRHRRWCASPTQLKAQAPARKRRSEAFSRP
jgi:hypothetical protein